MALLFGIYFFFPRLPEPRLGAAPSPILSLYGLLIGFLSSLLGVGGGIFIVPLLLAYQVPLLGAIATSSASTCLTTLIGSVTYLLTAWQSELPHTWGYIEIPAFLSLSLGSLLTARWGVFLARVLPRDRVKRVFAVVLAMTGISMLLR
jgi:uncharacterized membrane protein YfcA